MQDKLRIGIILTSNYNPKSGGGFGYYESLVKAIDEYNFNPLLEFVFIQQNEGPQVDFKKKILQFKFNRIIPGVTHANRRLQQANKIPVIWLRQRVKEKYQSRIPLLQKSKQDEEKASFEEWLVQQKVDLLYYLTPAGGHFNYPFVTTHWDIGHYSMFAFPEVSMSGEFERRENLYKKGYEKALAVFCESEAGKKELIRYKSINPGRIFFVPLFPGNMVHLDVSYDEQQSMIVQLGLTKRKYFFYPAQFWAHKNHYHLLLAFKQVIALYPDLKLVLPGSDKGNLEYIQTVIEQLDLKSSILIPGFISNDALYSLYKNAIALVMPTFLGPTNMPLLEAASLGCPIITTDLEGHKEILGDYATYINPADEDSIAKAMIAQIEDKSSAKPLSKTNINNIESAISQIENSFLEIRKVRKTWGFNFKES